MLQDQGIKFAVVKWDPIKGRTNVELNVTSVDEALTILCEGVVVVLRIGKKNGDTTKITQERLDAVKQRIWTGILERYDDPDVHSQITKPAPPTTPAP